MTNPAPQPPAAPGTAASRTVKVINQFGIHARPAALIVKTASAFASEVHLEKEGERVSAKSIMGLLTLEGHEGSTLIISAAGADAAEAVAAVADLFEKKFFED